jgi:glucan phosphoethanolaminetransferase (alkaline phosphatase superfamily)
MNAISPPRVRRNALCALATLIFLLMLPNLIWLWVGHGIDIWVCGLIVPSILLLLLFAALGDRLWIACLLMAPFAILAPMEAFYVAKYHRPTFAEIIATLVATNPREAREYLGNTLVPLVLCIIAAALLPLLAALWSWRSQLRWRSDSRTWVFVLVVIAPLAAAIAVSVAATGSVVERMTAGVQFFKSLSDPIQYGYPYGMVQRVAEYRRQWLEMRKNVARLDAFRFHAHRTSNIVKRQVYVLVIGEASRRDHWQLFGYSRPTNPELTRVRNLVPFPDMVSAWPESIAAIPMIVTRKSATSNPLGTWNEASILRAMQEAGFETWWISNQMSIGEMDSPVSTYAYEAQHTEFLNHASWTAPGSYDENLLKPLRDVLHDSNKDEFVVLHLMGSHQGYDFRYPDAYKRFRPALSDSADSVSRLDHAINSYDNTILYTDHVLASIIGILRDSNAVTALFYESDHGETLPTATCSLEGHGHGTRYDYEISALSWYSDDYAEAFPARVNALRSNAGKHLMSADTFESMIDMAGVEFPGHDPSMSVFSPQWRYRARITNAPWQVDIDHAGFGKGCAIVLPPNA